MLHTWQMHETASCFTASRSHVPTDTACMYMHDQSVQVHLQSAKVFNVIDFNSVDYGYRAALTMLADAVQP